MALFEASFRSKALNMGTNVNIILPDGGPTEDIPTLYLLHGMHGTYSSWLRKSNIERYAADYNIAVVMPSGENSFYTDMKYGAKYFTYTAEELVDFTRRVFRLSVKREKTFIAGLSMGGYGALRIALKKPEQYAAAASLSGCVDIAARVKVCNWQHEAIGIWGEDCRKTLPDSDGDLFRLVRDFPKNAPKPRIYSSCGRQDGLFADNVRFADFMKTEGIDAGFEFSFENGDGVHNWEYWDKWIVPALDFMLQK